MPTLLDALLIVHFVGLMFGAGGGFGSALAASYAKTLTGEQAQAVKGLGPRLANMSMGGLALMYVSGIALLALKYGDLGAMPMMFWVKLVLVGTLTLAACAIIYTYGQIRRGNAAVEKRLPVLGPIAGMSSLAAVVFAVLTFH
jgi:hypothetical protein